MISVCFLSPRFPFSFHIPFQCERRWKTPMCIREMEEKKREQSNTNIAFISCIFPFGFAFLYFAILSRVCCTSFNTSALSLSLPRSFSVALSLSLFVTYQTPAHLWNLMRHQRELQLWFMYLYVVFASVSVSLCVLKAKVSLLTFVCNASQRYTIFSLSKENLIYEEKLI